MTKGTSCRRATFAMTSSSSPDQVHCVFIAFPYRVLAQIGFPRLQKSEKDDVRSRALTQCRQIIDVSLEPLRSLSLHSFQCDRRVHFPKEALSTKTDPTGSSHLAYRYFPVLLCARIHFSPGLGAVPLPSTLKCVYSGSSSRKTNGKTSFPPP